MADDLCLFLVHNAACNDTTSTNDITAGRRKRDSQGINSCCMASATDTDSLSDTAYRWLSDGCQMNKTHRSRLPRLLTFTKVLYGISKVVQAVRESSQVDQAVHVS